MDEPTIELTGKARESLRRGAEAADVGKTFGDYELLGEIARGGMGIIYKARHTKLNRTVALKMILAGEFASEADVQRFHIEAEAAAQLDHPGIVPIYEVGEHNGHHYFSMALIDGDSLAARMAAGPMPPRDAAELMVEVAEAIQYAHDRGVIHRDLKPGNILLDKNQQPRITDFGLAKRIDKDASLTTTGQIVGTPSFMPPEQAVGKLGEITATADVYALGAILYTLVTGRPPFQASSPTEILLQVLEEPPVRPRALIRRLPRDLETIILKSLEKNKRSRYSTAADFAADLSRFLRGESIRARRTSTTVQTLRWIRRNPAKSIAMAAIAAILLAAAIILVMWNIDQSQWRFKTVDYSVTSSRGNLALVCNDLTIVFQNIPSTQTNVRTGTWRTDGTVYAYGVTLSIDAANGNVRASTSRHGIPGVITIEVRARQDAQPAANYTLYLSNNGTSWSTRKRNGEMQPFIFAKDGPGKLASITVGADGDIKLVTYVKSRER